MGVSEFAWERLRRAPDVEAPELRAFDATDQLLVQHALELAASSGLTGAEIAVIGDGYGAITLALADAGLAGIRVHQDLATGRRALTRNAAELGLGDFVAHELDDALLAGARLVLLQLPKSLAELEEIADAVARFAASDVVLIAGGRVKHMTLAQNDVLARFFAEVQPQRAARKSRLIVAGGALPVPAEPPFPVFATHALPGGGALTLAAHGGAFAGAKLDIGTRALLETLAARSQLRKNGAETGDSCGFGVESDDSSGVVDQSPRVIDLGCGTGALAAAFALHDPAARVLATDRSAAAVRSARATMAANGLIDRVEVALDDAGSEIPDASADAVLLNPPFHLGTSVHTGAATRLFEAAARLLRPGGDLFTVWNSALRYRPELERIVGPTEQLSRTPKFTVTRSRRP